jgi:hypothetical protein
MVVPRFTIRALLGLITLCAFAFVIAGFAFRGERWALAICVGLATILVTLLVHAMWFGVVWLLARLTSKRLPSPDERAA